MKYGLIYYKDTENLGDDILSYAGKRFLPQIDYYIDRENMDLFLPEKKEYVAAILNGWYIHYSYAFPPSPYLLPFFSGTHFNIDPMIYGDYAYLDGAGVEYLKKYTPIGCRDPKTMEMLQQKGVDSYFSGCLTLTLQKYADVQPNHMVFLTDVSDRVSEYVRSRLLDREVLNLTHRFTKQEKGWMDWEKREERVETYLKRYQGADLVITKRLHCALPCIALDVPVILIVEENQDYYDRINCFTPYVTSCTEEELLSGKVDERLLHPVPNGSVKELVDGMEAEVRQYVEKMRTVEPDTSQLPDPSLYHELFVERSINMRRAIHRLLARQISLVMQHHEDVRTMEKVMALARKLTGAEQ